MSVTEEKALRRRVTDQETFAERARKLFIVPKEIPDGVVTAMGSGCQATIAALYTLNGSTFVLNNPVSTLTQQQKFDILKCLDLPNGIKLVLVDIVGDAALLTVDFFNTNYLDVFLANAAVVKSGFPISGGHRVPAGQATGQVQVESIAASPGNPAALLLTIRPIGDYSTYRLRINTAAYPASPPVIIDPLFNDIDFKFRPGCFNTNCAPGWSPAPTPNQQPVIDYLAKDYDSFRHTMIAAMMERVPGWQPTSEADLDQVLLELFSAGADELSDFQDRVMNEAYLSTTRKRVSLARHARLMDYHIHQGNQASTWLALEVALTFPSDPEPGATNIFYYLADDFKVWSGTDKEDLSSVVFLTRGKKRVHDLVNRLGLYTWGDAIKSLEPGDTSADLKLFLRHPAPAPNEAKNSATAVQDLIRSGEIRHLLIEERLNPATGSPVGRDLTRRQLLRLLPGDEGAVAMFDPTTGPPATAEWFVRVRWDDRDKLRSHYCFTVDCGPGLGKVENVSLFHGNLVKVNHGRQAVSTFKEAGSPLTSPDQFYYLRPERAGEDGVEQLGAICYLPERPLAYRNTLPGGDVPPQSSLSVIMIPPGGDADEWDEVPSFIHSDGSDENGNHFIVETDEQGYSLIRFGDGINGKELPEEAEVICTYQFGNGLDGNIGLDKLVNFDRTALSFIKLDANPDPDVEGPTVEGSLIACWNPFDVTNGRAPEPAAEIIRRVPEAYRARQLRAVTLKDYVNRAQELPEVSRAAARYAWTGSWRTVQITIDPAGTTILEDGLRRRIARYLDAVRLIGEDLEVRAPRFVPLEIHVVLCALPDYWPEDLQFIIEQEFSDGWTPDGRMGFFHPDLWTFGQPLRASQIIGRLQAIEGIDHVKSVTMKRWNEPSPGTNEIANLRHNEIIQVKNDPDHMEKGFIDFDIKGGRQ